MSDRECGLGAAQLESLINRLMERWSIPACAIGVVKDLQIEYVGGFGFANIEHAIPATPDTRFAIGSMTKAFTATAIGVLAQIEKLDIDKPIRCYLPEFKLRDPNATEQATPRDLLCHRTGVPEHLLLWYQSGLSRSELIRRLGYLESTAGFREKFQYQNLMHTTLGQLVEQVSQQPFERFVKQHVFEPLGMADTRFDCNGDATAIGYLCDNGRHSPMPYYDDSATAPQGGIYSSVVDMMNWLSANLSPNASTGFANAVAMCHEPQIALPVQTIETNYCPGSYAMGWNVTAYAGRTRLTHSGGIDGFCSVIDFLPEDGCGLVVMTNLHGAPVPNSCVFCYAAALTIYDMILGNASQSWEDKMASRLADFVAKREAERAANQLRRKPLSLAELEQICGEYQNPAYGDVRISQEDEHPCIHYRGCETPLDHCGNLQFRVELCSQKVDVSFDDGSQEMIWTFNNGAVARFTRG